MPDVCRAYDAYDAYDAYEVWKGLFLTPSTSCVLLPPPAGGPPPSRREVWGFRRSRPPALPSIGYRGFAVAPMTLRASSKNCCYNVGDERARDSRPYGGRRCNQRLQMHLTVAMMQPSVANASHSCNFPQRCRGAHRAPADIIQTFRFSTSVAFTLNIFFFRHTHRTYEAHEAYEGDFSKRL